MGATTQRLLNLLIDLDTEDFRTFIKGVSSEHRNELAPLISSFSGFLNENGLEKLRILQQEGIRCDSTSFYAAFDPSFTDQEKRIEAITLLQTMGAIY